MSKFYGVIGYAETYESPEQPGVWVNNIREIKYYGELTRNTRRLQGANKVNDDIDISNLLSIIADPYAVQNFHNMRYVEFMGTRWKINSVEVQYPRLILTLGGVYNGE